MTALARLTEPRIAAALILLGAGATIGAALAFEHLGGYRPCPLCLWQRWPYYVGLPVAFGLFLWGPNRPGAGLGFAALCAIFLVSAGLGAYHSGVEWGWFLGPSDCAAAARPAAPAGMADFLRQLETTRVVSCTEAAWRFLGVSMAGWNALISAGIAGLAALALVKPRSWPA
ncbi:MAG TPA: disulfide bond formation protein B [Beijerinckiaceae bacterium]|nr:disulfide bond formation protein B [Beijerinckiaceae bacterium]